MADDDHGVGGDDGDRRESSSDENPNDHRTDPNADDDRGDLAPDDHRTDPAPLSELRGRVERRRGRRGDTEAPAENAPLSDLAREQQGRDRPDDDPFETVEVGAVDAEALWNAVVDAEATSASASGSTDVDAVDVESSAANPTASVDTGAETVADEADQRDEAADERVVDKREFCQRCEFFSAPPEVSCTNEGTEIVELVDADRFRVRNCPKVADDDETFTTRIDEA